MTAHDLTLTLIGGPTVLIEIGGLRLLTDPTFDPPGHYHSGPVHLEKQSGPALAPDAIGPIDAILLSHDQHADNLDHAGRAFLAHAPLVLTTRIGAGRLGGHARGLDPFETITIGGTDGQSTLTITAAPARHGPAGIEPIAGDVIGFLIGQEQPGDTLYVTGDTVWYDGTAEIARRYAPAAVIAFAGSAEPRGRFHLTMDNNDVIETASAFPRARIIAVHNHGWAHFKESEADLVAAFTALGIADRLTSLAPGVPTRLPLGPAS
ncbi:MBL fold metallo-hydrolase [Kaistia dalseonensis]|uniref:L-ascorbate metabolism protein UlaG (Beta-lactamase superfamily) n=1 Tax=Kaistia dalseonensis TaxID=410840 RepID=A0ABU0HBS0_9HYPH|nr:MBL fold metallo-hydrolase [Kaistia dalseonensis]MCX5497137.1 MBL fold metallo-hydrolase [Kaistia dalseonensis]MDQ0439764.1 L-ascorbate metabolism protein UlaG (beta-lactamase superfamily) [Kaistia dalseonensis]